MGELQQLPKLLASQGDVWAAIGQSARAAHWPIPGQVQVQGDAEGGGNAWGATTESLHWI